MDKKSLRIYLDYTIELLKAVILDNTPSEVPEQIDLDRLFEFCCSHKIENIVYIALKKTDTPQTELNRFETRYMHGVIVDSNQQYYLSELENAFNANNIAFLPMKGSVLKYVYPSTELRQSGDLDIFFRDEDSEKVKSVMTDMGFATLEYNRSAMHDTYSIENVALVEMHRALITEHYTQWTDLCKEIEDSMRAEDSYKMAISDEYYYMYMIMHMAKHMKYGGIGIRFILDIWVYLREYHDRLDWDFINEKLDKSKLLVFEQITKKLSEIWFDEAEYDNTTRELADYIAANGVFGSHEQYVTSEYVMNYGDKKITFTDKLNRYVKSMFIGYNQMAGLYPILRKYKFLLPFCWAHRAVKTVIFKRERFKQIYNYYDNVEQDKIEKMKEFKGKIGL